MERGGCMGIAICSILGLVTLVILVIFELKWVFWLTDRLLGSPKDSCVGDWSLSTTIFSLRGLLILMVPLIAAFFIGGPTGGLIMLGCEVAGALIGRLLVRVAIRYHKDIYGDNEKNDRH